MASRFDTLKGIFLTAFSGVLAGLKDPSSKANLSNLCTDVALKSLKMDDPKTPENPCMVCGYFDADDPAHPHEALEIRFENMWDKFSILVADWADRKGWWDDERSGVAARNNAELAALVHTEISEVVEGLRHGNPPDDKIPDFSSAEAEYADAVIRIMDIAKHRGYRVGAAIVAKMRYNEGRPYKHGKQF